MCYCIVEGLNRTKEQPSTVSALTELLTQLTVNIGFELKINQLCLWFVIDLGKSLPIRALWHCGTCENNMYTCEQKPWPHYQSHSQTSCLWSSICPNSTSHIWSTEKYTTLRRPSLFWYQDCLMKGTGLLFGRNCYHFVKHIVMPH